MTRRFSPETGEQKTMNIKLKDEASWELCMKCGNKEEINASNSKYVSPHE